jgi:lipopolysaccharide exporter
VQKIKNLLNKLTFSGASLSEKTVKGGFWVFTLRIADRIFNLIKIIILARLLSPNDFGIFAIALLVLSIFDTFTQTGFQQALIQKKGEIKSYLNTAWTYGLARGLIIAAIVFFISKPAAIFFSTPGSEMIIKIMGVSIIIQSLNNITVLYFHKELHFHKFFKYQFLGTITDVTVTIAAAFFLKSVWALLIGLLAGNIVRCIMSYIIEPYRPKLQFNFSQAKELYNFTTWILGSTILIYLIINGDDIFVGKLLGATMLGFYQMAYTISNTPATEITLVVSQVSFPAYSKLQDDLPRLREAYLRILKLTAFLSFPLAGLIFILSKEFTQLFLSEKWMPIVPAMKILVVAGAIRSLVASTCSVFRATGKPKIETIWQIIRLSIIVALIYPFSMKWGIAGTSIVILLSTFISSIGFSVEILKILKCNAGTYIKIIVLPLVNGLIMVLAVYALKFYINAGTYTGFFILAFISILIFIGLNYLFDRYLNYGILLTIKKALGSLKS